MLALPGRAQLPETQQEYWRQVDEQMRQQEQERWSREMNEQSMMMQEQMYQEEQPEWRQQAPGPDPVSTMLRQSTAMAVLAQGLLSDPKVEQLRRGFWEFHALGKEFRSAMFLNGDGVISVHGPGGSYPGALLILWGPNIPRPAQMTLVPVTLQQNQEKPVTVRAFNYGFPGVTQWGTLIFAVPSAQALIDNMEDEHHFTATMNEQVVFSSGWHDGKAAAARLAGDQPLPGEP